MSCSRPSRPPRDSTSALGHPARSRSRSSLASSRFGAPDRPPAPRPRRRPGGRAAVRGGAAAETPHLAPDVETLAQRLAGVHSLVAEGLATSMYLSLRLP